MKKILIIEDNDTVRENIAEILELSQYKTIQAENGKMGITKAIEEYPDLILCDVMMPELDGYGVLNIINKRPDLQHIPLIFLTAKADNEDFRKGMGLGAVDYITKPFDDLALLEAIEIRLKKAENLMPKEAKPSATLLVNDEAYILRLIEKLIQDREIRLYNAKSIVYQYDQFPKWIYYVKKGHLKSFITNDGGKELILDLHGANKLLGVRAAILNDRYSASLQCLEDAELILVPIQAFQNLILTDGAFAVWYLKYISRLHESLQTRELDHAYSSVRKKIANALIKFNQFYKSNRFYVSREDIASLAGVAKETGIRTLSAFKSEGIIDMEDNDIVIIDMSALKYMPQ
ncbi:MAG TPA: response regulator [Saprospiraceae bacterium]|nr:response regulator [Saprospiraceae bacterium]MCB9328762.1 response regulator [Lewinellaceae bacterium]HPK09243.1 response regulator [Saprospiraceae bacterium]HRX27882.1 response regulator [Saprospiraceae bacterium]